MNRVLIDGRVTGHDGIGRYTACLTGAIRELSGPELQVTVLEPTGTPRYSRAEGSELAETARNAGADLIHVLDYRIPIELLTVPIVATIYDVLRLDERHCYTNDQFAIRFGDVGLSLLREAVYALRPLSAPGALGSGAHGKLHAEYYARMLDWTCRRACRVVTPTKTVAHQLTGDARLHAEPAAIALGIDHLPPYSGTGQPTPPTKRILSGRYLLYVGQARPHKGLPDLLAAYQYSQASRDGVHLVCVGRDFAPGTDAHRQLSESAGSLGISLGAVPDAALRQLYAGAEALIHLAEHEGFGFTPLEAMAAGTRVIASNIPVLRETLGCNAHFTDPGNPRDVARIINRVLAEPDNPRDLDARRRWVKRYTWHRHATHVLCLYRECLSAA